MMLQMNKHSLLLIWILCLPAAWASNNLILSPLPTNVTKNWSNFELVGQTTLRRYGFEVYDSSFWVLGDKASDYLINNTCALSITYTRKIRAQQLLSSTKKEWEHLGFVGKYPLDAWLTILSNIWPDVDKGDQLVIVATPEGKSIFYSNNQVLGTIDDPDFGNAFLSIWLSEKSRYKQNRRELLGG
jgi:hypothetical protein